MFSADRKGEWGLVSSDGLSQDFVQSVSEEGAATPPPPKSPLAFEDVTQAPFLALRQTALRREGIRSTLVVPLHIHDQIFGTVVFYWKAAHKFSESEIRIASALGNMAAAALGTSDLYERERELRKQAQLSRQKRHWRIAIFVMEIVLLTTWAFLTGKIYSSSSREYLASTFVLGASFIFWLVWERSRIL